MAVKKEKKVSNKKEVTQEKPKKVFKKKPNLGFTPEQEAFIEKAVLSKKYASRRKIWEAGLEEFGEDNFTASHSSTNTYINYLEFHDDSEPWYIDPDADAAKNIICLEVLAEVVYRTEGRVQHLTTDQAKWIAAIHTINPNINFVFHENKFT